MPKLTRKFFITATVALFLFGLAPANVNAASLYLSPDAKILAIGQTFNVDVIINTDDVAINAAEGVIHYQTSVLELERVDVSNSVFNFSDIFHQGRDGQKSIKPTPGLINRFGDIVSRIVVFKILPAVFQIRIAPLSERHRAGIKPDINDGFLPRHLSAAITG